MKAFRWWHLCSGYSFATLSLRMWNLSWQSKGDEKIRPAKPKWGRGIRKGGKITLSVLFHNHAFLKVKKGNNTNRGLSQLLGVRSPTEESLFIFRQILGVPSWAPGKCLWRYPLLGWPWPPVQLLVLPPSPNGYRKILIYSRPPMGCVLKS